MGNFSIDYYSKSEAAVSITWGENSSETVERFLDSLLFGCYLIRQFRNLGNHPSNRALIKEITCWSPQESSNLEALLGWTVYPETSHKSHVLFHAAISLGIDPDHAVEKYGQEIYLVPFAGKGKKVFYGVLGFANNHPIFLLHVSGFGLLGRNIPLYSTDSVFHLFAFLCKKYPLDLSYPSILIRIAQGCAAAYVDNSVTSLNQELIALGCVNKYLRIAT